MNWWGKSPETTPDSILKIGFHFLRINKSCVNQKKILPMKVFLVYQIGQPKRIIILD